MHLKKTRSLGLFTAVQEKREGGGLGGGLRVHLVEQAQEYLLSWTQTCLILSLRTLSENTNAKPEYGSFANLNPRAFAEEQCIAK